MREADIDLSTAKPKSCWLRCSCTLTGHVTLSCGAACPFVPTVVEDWDVPDPAGRPLGEVRAIRDAIARRVTDLAGARIDAIRSGRTAQQARLYRILPALITEFAHMHSDEEIRACADAVLDTTTTSRRAALS